MDRSDFSFLVARLERQAIRSPGGYAFKVKALAVLGYLSLFVFAAVIVGCVCLAISVFLTGELPVKLGGVLAALVKLGVRAGDRVGTIAPNTHQHLEQHFAVPQIGAVIVPMNYRLIPDDFVFLVNHSDCKVMCVHEDYLEMVDSVRHRMRGVRQFVALEGSRPGWLEYESLLAQNDGLYARPDIAETDLIAQRACSSAVGKSPSWPKYGEPSTTASRKGYSLRARRAKSIGVSAISMARPAR